MPIARLIRFLCRKRLTETGPPSTFVRLWTSNHLSEIQWIAFATPLLWSFGLVILGIHFFPPDRSQLRDLGTLFTGMTGLAGAVLAWCYRTGSNRLGMIDLFACEISVICRASLVVDFARRSVAQTNDHDAQMPPSDEGSHLRSIGEDHYTPVYDSNLSELQALDVNVVTHVTEFYTYRKVMMDYLRRMAVTQKTERAMMIYMQFLMYESGRPAIQALIEFEPNREESIINILCSELIVFKFLVELFDKDDYRGKRLRLRKYKAVVDDTLGRTEAGRGYNWVKAKTTAQELKQRYMELEQIDKKFSYQVE